MLDRDKGISLCCTSLPQPNLLAISIAAALSDRMWMCSSWPSHLAKLRRKRPWMQPFTTPLSSAYPDESEGVGCVTLQCLIGWRPRMAMPPDVDRRVTWHPPKSVSEKTSNEVETRSWSNFQIIRGLWTIHLTNCFSFCTLLDFGSANSLPRNPSFVPPTS